MACRGSASTADSAPGQQTVTGLYIQVACPFGSEDSKCHTCRNGLKMWVNIGEKAYDEAVTEGETELRGRLYQHLQAVHADEVTMQECEHCTKTVQMEYWGHEYKVSQGSRSRSPAPIGSRNLRTACTAFPEAHPATFNLKCMSNHDLHLLRNLVDIELNSRVIKKGQ
jgi:hypothetical protein